MAILILGKSNSSALEVDGSTLRAVRTFTKPMDPGVLGAYGFSAVTGTLAAALAANAVVFSARWTNPRTLAVVTSLRWRFQPLTPFTAGTLTDHTSFDTFIARAFTASHTGGTGITLTTETLKRRQNPMPSTAFGDLRISTTAALAGGTLTLAPHPFAQSIRKGNRVNPALGTEEVIMPYTDGSLWMADTGNAEHPIILSMNEGIIIRNRTVWPAAGTGILLVEMNWSEVMSY